MEKITIFYFFDALCGWCFGFSPVIEKIYEKYKEDFDFQIISGGLKLGNDVGPIGVVAPYIKAGAYKQVEQMCGVKFGDNFIRGPLEEGKLVLNSLTPAIAMSIVKVLKPLRAFEFGALMHRALYVDGEDIADINNYGKYVERIGIDGDKFTNELKNSVYEELAQKDFQLTKSYGVKGFPALIAEQDGHAIFLSKGYLDYPSLAGRLSQIKK